MSALDEVVYVYIIFILTYLIAGTIRNNASTLECNQICSPQVVVKCEVNFPWPSRNYTICVDGVKK